MFSCWVLDLPINVPLTRVDGTGIAAAHGYDYVDLVNSFMGELFRLLA